MQSHLPYTIIYKQDKNIRQMLNNFGTIYLKANNSRYSRHVICIEKLMGGYYQYRYVRGQLVLQAKAKWEILKQFYQSFFRKRKFIIQEAIPRLCVNDRTVDMRAELQRNFRGDLEIVAISARLGALSSPVSNIQDETSIYKLSGFCKKYLSLPEAELNNLFNRINVFLKKVYLSVEETYSTFGDMGIDFALDNSFNLWLIECNSKSSKIAMFLCFEPPVIYRSFLNPLEYAKFITGNNPK